MLGALTMHTPHAAQYCYMHGCTLIHVLVEKHHRLRFASESTVVNRMIQFNAIN